MNYKNKWVGGYETTNEDTGKLEYYDEFLTAKGAENLWGEEKKELEEGDIITIKTTKKKYWDNARIKYHPLPERFEEVEKLPPTEPPQPRNKPHSIAIDAATNSGLKTGVSSYTWSHECTGDDRLLVVGDSHRGFFNDRTVTGMTFNGDALTSIRSDNRQVSNDHFRTTLFYRIAPDTGGSLTIEVSLSGSVSGAVGGAVSYTGTDQDSQPDAHNGANGSSETATVDVTTIANNSWVVSVMIEGGNNVITSDNTERWNVASSNVFGGSDEGPISPAGAQTMSWTWSGADDWVISAASFKPVEEAPAGQTRKIKIAGTFVDKPVKIKIAGTFVDKPRSIKVGGSFQDA